MRQLAAAAVFLALAAPAWATEAQVDALWSALRFKDYGHVLVAEGQSYGKDLGDALFPGEADGSWGQTVRGIYDRDAMMKVLSRELHARLDHVEMGKAVAFFESKTGAKSVALEISAREALLDPDVEDNSVAHMRSMEAGNDPRLKLVREFSDANGLIENNVMGTMNGNYAFLTALTKGGEGPYTDDPGGILTGVWRQEDQIRADTEEWVLSFFAFAYSPLSDDEVQQLIDFSATDQGRRLNEALFGTFDALFEGLARQLGTAAAAHMKGERL